MEETKIGIVEDEVIIADSIRSALRSMHYTVPEPCMDYKEAIAMLHTEQPDLVLLDINLAGHEQDGIAVAKYIRNNLHLPFIFLTANSDAATLLRAKQVHPNAFLVKPFVQEDLYVAIEIAMHNFYSTAPTVVSKPENDHIFIKEGSDLYKVNFDDILYLESDHVYVSVYTKSRKHLVRTSLQHYAAILDNKMFIRIHRGYIVNRHKIDKVSPTQLVISNTTLPISKKYRDALLGLL